MSYEYVVDSYAWIEYFRGSEAGKKARDFIEKDKSATATITLAELSEKYAREGWSYFNEDLLFIASTTIIVNLTKEIAVKAGEINAVMKAKVKGWGMADSIILATAQVAKAKVITGDKHFGGLKEAILIKQNH
ncbi:MAG: PIN domain-containing protein [Candidatus Bathyarchaeia archaeon]